MKSISQLSDFYYKRLYPELESLEKERKALKNRLITLGIIYLTAGIVLLSWLLKSTQSPEILMFVAFAFVSIAAFGYKFMTQDYKAAFKSKIIAPLITHIDSRLSYSPELFIDPHYFTHSKIFTQTPDRINGSDYVWGAVDGVMVKFSYLHAEKKHKDSKGRTTWSTIFQGLLIVSDFNKHFKGSTLVLGDSAQSSFGDLIGSWLQSNNFTREELIKMDDVAFEREFVVYGSDQIESRYILTPSLMQKITAFKRRSKRELDLSFVNANITIAIHTNEEPFKPSILHSLLNYTIAMEQIETLHLATSLVEELKLNQKLWSKT